MFSTPQSYRRPGAPASPFCARRATPHDEKMRRPSRVSEPEPRFSPRALRARRASRATPTDIGRSDFYARPSDDNPTASPARAKRTQTKPPPRARRAPGCPKMPQIRDRLLTHSAKPAAPTHAPITKRTQSPPSSSRLPSRPSRLRGRFNVAAQPPQVPPSAAATPRGNRTRSPGTARSSSTAGAPAPRSPYTCDLRRPLPAPE